MKSTVVFLTLMLAGCTSAPTGNRLTAEQAQMQAVQLANDKTASLYHVQPFHDDPPARFAEGRWVWTDRRGVGNVDMQVTVELAADGSTNSVDLKVFDSMNRPLGQTITK